MKENPFKIISINTSLKKGQIKSPVASVMLIADFGIKGDAHGAPGDRQVSFLAQEDVNRMKKKKFDLKPGDFAENFTTEGVALADLPIGTVIKMGNALLKISKIGKECHQGCEVFKQIGSCIMPRRGIFAEVIVGGEVNNESNCYYCQ